MNKGNVLITPTLLDSFEFAKNAPPSWKQRALQDFIAKVKREPTTFPKWVSKGIEFEDAVYDACKTAKRNKLTEITAGSQHFQKVANACLGGSFQEVRIKTLIVRDLEVRCYHKMDVLFPDKIIDIKTTLNWKGEAKYLKGWQHKMYTWAAEIPEFSYLVAVWEDEDSTKISSIESVEYSNNDFEKSEKELVAGIEELFDFLAKMQLFDAYYYTFSKNK